MSPSSFPGSGDGGREVLWEGDDRVVCRGWHEGASSEPTPALLVLPLAERPVPGLVDRLTHEYNLRDNLDGSWAARPLELGCDGGRTMLVLEDSGGEPLDRHLDAPMEIGRFLRVAVGIAAALAQVHRRGLVHKDIKPANILVNRTTGDIRLTGFGIASRVPRERQTPAPPETIAGTLAYMAPEQTGRMNRSIDARSDLYALGVTFYQMLTGSLPFTATDPMEWVHCHIARKPPLPAERFKNVPVALTAIISKLLAKTAEERYQTARGVERDLRRCLAEWDARGTIEIFAPGQQDTPDRLLIPEKLYGREREAGALLAAFDRIVKSGAPELVLVSGYSGIGKSSVVNELHRALVPPRGLFAAGKFDQYKRDIPYATLAQAFQSLVRPLLGKSDTELSGWRDALLEALAPNARLMVDVVPELKLIIGEQPPVPELPPQDAQRRFQLVFQRFIGVFARPEHPLALFLDDLQWLDAATLDLLEDLLTRSDLQHLMLIGAYRDNEVTAAHPLMRTLDAVRAAGGKVTEIALAPLAREHLGQLIADALRCEPSRAAPLAQLVHEKTGGNPFFAIQFISSLGDEGLLAFDHDAACWSWDLDRIHAKEYADNVVDLMVEKLSRLPAETRAAVQQLACIGNTAETTMLAIAFGTSEELVHDALSEAVFLELVERLNGSYKFVHDRVQEAAYSLIPDASRVPAHLRIGRLLAAQTPSARCQEMIFEIVNQLNRGAALITEQDERERLAELNLIAGRRAKASTAYASARTYLSVGMAVLGCDGWTRRYKLAFALALERAECEYLNGDFDEAERLIAELLAKGASKIDKAAAYRLKIDLHVMKSENPKAVESGLDCLRLFGIEMPAHPTNEQVEAEYNKVWSGIGERPIESLIDLPLMTDPEMRAAMRVLSVLFAPAHFTDMNLLRLDLCHMVNITLRCGTTDASAHAYAWFGVIVGPVFKGFTDGYRFVKLACDLVEKYGMVGYKAKTYFSMEMVAVWTQPLQVAIDAIRTAFRAGVETGDVTIACYSCNHTVSDYLARGDHLDVVWAETERGLDFARKANFRDVVDIIVSQQRFINNMRGRTAHFSTFSDTTFDVDAFEAQLTADRMPTMVCWYWIIKVQARFMSGDYETALAASHKARSLLWSSDAHIQLLDYHYYTGLALAGAYESASPDRRNALREDLETHLRQLREWAETCSATFHDKHVLLAAEVARIERRDLDAMRHYDEAIRFARENGFVQNEGIGNELAARFYAARDFEKVARVYLRDARRCYARWGAQGKVAQLDALYPHLREDEPVAGPTRTIGTRVEHLDLATVVKVSQAVSGEIVLEKLIDTLVRTAMAQAGAERVLLVLAQGAAQRVAAEATMAGDTVTVHLRDEAVTESVLPESVLHYVLRTQESLILDDAPAHSPFSDDPYIRNCQARSVLCLPLLNHATLIGALYLENNLAPRVFTPAGVTVLKLLASQAAISIENTRLYRDLADREARIRRLVDANIIGVYMWDSEGRILEANDAFLRMVGYQHGDLAAGRLDWATLTPPEWRKRTARAVAEKNETGAIQPFEKEYFRKDGSRVPVLLGSASFDESGQQGVTFVIDLTARKRTEQALRDSESKLEEAQRIAHVGHWERDIDSALITWSEESFRIFGLKPEGRVAVARYLDLIHPDDRQSITMAVAEALRGGPRYDVEYRVVRPDGDVRIIHSQGDVRRDESGRPRCMFGIVQDITERKRAEEDLRESDRRYRETQMELAHANRVATMGQLTASIAHEVNQPIGATVTNAQAALRWLNFQPPNLERVRQGLTCIVEDGLRAGEVIGRIREQVKKAPPRNDMFDINDTIREVIGFARGEMIKNGVAVHVQLPPGLPLIRGERVQLQQVMLNLIVNAVEAMSGVEEGPRDLLIDTAADGDGIRVSISDSGPGLSPESLGRLFEPFYTTKPSGMGMGLSICRSIVEAHDGHLSATTNVPRGAVFQFTLPAREECS